jgi:hypothetical protein
MDVSSPDFQLLCNDEMRLLSELFIFHFASPAIRRHSAKTLQSKCLNRIVFLPMYIHTITSSPYEARQVMSDSLNVSSGSGCLG